jgi:hypothetical protein
MEKSAKVVFRKRAKCAIRDIAFYVEMHGYPETAENFAEKLVHFGLSLSVFPGKYPVCRQPQFAKRNMHCAVFHKDYIFVYKLVKNELIIYNLIHCNTNPAFQSA